MNLNEQLKQQGALDKFNAEVKEIIASMTAQLKRVGHARKSFCNASNWDHKVRHMNAVQEYFESEGLRCRRELKFEVWDLYVEVQ